jgi:hypothetical protein
MDADHLYDYYQWYVKRGPASFTFYYTAGNTQFCRAARIGVGILSPLSLAAVATHLGHVIIEHLHNNISPLGYSIIYRIINRFNASVIVPRHNPSDAYWKMLDVLPYGKRLAPWFKKSKSSAGTLR